MKSLIFIFFLFASTAQAETWQWHLTQGFVIGSSSINTGLLIKEITKIQKNSQIPNHVRFHDDSLFIGAFGIIDPLIIIKTTKEKEKHRKIIIRNRWICSGINLAITGIFYKINGNH